MTAQHVGPQVSLSDGMAAMASLLEGVTPFRFHARSGPVTLRREVVGRGSYWYAYRRVGGRLRKTYVGRAADISMEMVEDAAARLAVRDHPMRLIGADFENASDTPIIGREGDLTSLRDILLNGSARLLTVYGAPGVGKSRLGRALCSLLMADGQSEIRLLDGTQVRTVGRASRAMMDAISSVRNHSSKPQLVLVLDHFDAVPEVGESPFDQVLALHRDVTLLLLARRPTRAAAEVRYRLPPLAVPESPPLNGSDRTENEEPITPSVHLYCLLAGLAPPIESVAMRHIETLCRKLDGLPLALSVAAAHAGVVSASEFTDRFDALESLPGALPSSFEPHRDIFAAIQPSYDRLHATDKIIFRRLAIFQGRFSLPDVEPYLRRWGEPKAPVMASIERLLDNCLIEPVRSSTTSELEMLNVIRQFGRAQLRDEGEQAKADAYLVAAMADVAEELEEHLRSHQQEHAIRRLAGLEPTFHYCLDTAFRDPVHDITAIDASRLATNLWWFWYLRGDYSYGRRWMSKAVEIRGASKNSYAYANAAVGAAFLAEAQGDLDTADALAQSALELTGIIELGDLVPHGIAVRGLVARGRRQHDQARSFFDRSIELARERDDQWLVAASLMWRASVEFLSGDSELARHLLDESLSVGQVVGDKLLSARALAYLGHAQSGNHVPATGLYERSLAMFRALGDRGGGAAWLLVQLAEAHEIRGDAEKAGSLYTRAGSFARPFITRLALEGLGRWATYRGEFATAVTLIGAASTIAQEVGSPPSRLQKRTERMLARAREGLGAEAALTAWRFGRTVGPALVLQDGQVAASLGRIGLGQRLDTNGTLTSLTRRERQVALLAAKGYRNREIAASLLIAESTVASHLAHLFAKLHITSRTRLASLVHDSERSHGGQAARGSRDVAVEQPVDRSARPTTEQQSSH